MRKMTSDEFWSMLNGYSDYVILEDEDIDTAFKIMEDKENLFPARPAYIVCHMQGEYNDEGGTYNVLSEIALFDKNDEEIFEDSFQKSDVFYELRELLRDYVHGDEHDEVVIPLEKNFMPVELYIDDKDDTK